MRVTEEADPSGEETGGRSPDGLDAERRQKRETLSDQGVEDQADRT